MTTNELRIGNIIRHNVKDDETGGYTEPNDDVITEDDFFHFIAGTGLKDAEPVVLTEEWLLKLGFILEEESNHRFPNTKDTFDRSKTITRLDRVYFITKSDDRYEPDGTEMSVLVILDPDTLHQRSMSIKGVRNKFIAADLQYVHQLQNLYFALCGEELQIEKQ